MNPQPMNPAEVTNPTKKLPAFLWWTRFIFCWISVYQIVAGLYMGGLALAFFNALGALIIFGILYLVLRELYWIITSRRA